jgi:hypothetical protein
MPPPQKPKHDIPDDPKVYAKQTVAPRKPPHEQLKDQPVPYPNQGQPAMPNLGQPL